jgi:hypothetical protein
VRKTEQLCVRVTAEEIATLRELATRQSIRLSEFVRRALAEKAAESGAAGGGLFRRLAGAVHRASASASLARSSAKPRVSWPPCWRPRLSSSLSWRGAGTVGQRC